MRWLVSSDLHQSDRPKDKYRFGLYNWLVKQQEKYNPDATFFLGDITESKDRHSSKLVNRVVKGLKRLRPPVIIDQGNHDAIDPASPFFGFLSHIEGLTFVNKPTYFPHLDAYFIPHRKNQAELDKAAGMIVPKVGGVFLHNTIDGSIAESGSRLSGLRASLVEARHPRGIWSGDIHRPQRVGCVTYVGSPYHVRFGDDFTPRVLLITDGVEKNLYFDTVHKWQLTISDPYELLDAEELYERDHVKITLNLAREEAVDWPKHRQLVNDICKELKLEVFGIDLQIVGSAPRERQTQVRVPQTNEEVLEQFCNNENLDKIKREAGKRLLAF